MSSLVHAPERRRSQRADLLPVPLTGRRSLSQQIAESQSTGNLFFMICQGWTLNGMESIVGVFLFL